MDEESGCRLAFGSMVKIKKIPRYSFVHEGYLLVEVKRDQSMTQMYLNRNELLIPFALDLAIKPFKIFLPEYFVQPFL